MRTTAGHAHAPLLLDFEVIHVLSRKQRQGVITVGERDSSIRLLRRQLISYDALPDEAALQRIASLADSERLSGYDAAYLELAIRLGADLGTLDGDLAEAGRRCGLTVHHTA